MRYHDLELWFGSRSGETRTIHARCRADHGSRTVTSWAFDPEAAEASIARGEGLPLGDVLPHDVHLQIERCFGATLGRERAGVRLKLVVDDPALAAFPWEYLSDGGSFLGASIRTPLVRSLDLPQAARPLTASPPLRMLVVIPNDPELDASAEAASLREALGRVGSGIQPTFLEGEVTRRRLTDATEAASFHILHFVGHGDFDGERAVLVLNGEDGEADPVDAAWMAALLRNQDRMRLVVLNSCRGASVSSIRPLTGMAPELVRLGIPAVVAMQDEIFDDDAIRFARAFYTRLTIGEDRGRVDIALCHARNELLKEASGPLSVGIPVLFARSPDGVLFHLRSGGLADLPFGGGARDTALAVMDALARTAKAARGEAREDVAEGEAEELRRLRRRVRFRDASVLAAGAVALVVFFGFWMGVLDWLPKELKPEHYTVWIGDMLREHPLHEAVALVTIDPATFEALGHPYVPDAAVFAPEWRTDHARILDRLGEAGASVVAFDFVFDTPRAHLDTAFARAISDGAAGRGPRVVLAARAWADDTGTQGAAAEPHIAPSLWSAGPGWGTACLGLPRHAPNVVPLLARRPGVAARPAPAFALAAVAAARGPHTYVFDTASVNVGVVGDGVADLWVQAARIGRPAEGGPCSILATEDVVAEMILPYSPLDSLLARRVPYEDVVRGDSASLARLEGRIVFVGAEVGADRFGLRRGLRREERYGVQLHADAASAILSGNTYRWLSDGAQFALILLMALGGATTAGSGASRGRHMLVLAVVGAGYLGLALYLYLAHGLLANALYHVLALYFGYRVARGLRRRYFL